MNVVAFRATTDHIPFWAPRSQCPSCHSPLQLLELIPVFSWLWLRGICRYCSAPISPLYVVIECITALAAIAMVAFHPPHYWVGLTYVASALIITIRTDLASMVISRYCTLFAIPVIVLLIACGLLPGTVGGSLAGALLGFGLLRFVAACYHAYTGEVGMGAGDPELMGCIGAAVGPWGTLATIAIGSLVGTMLAACWLMLYGGTRKTALPFGAALAAAGLYQLLIANHLALW
ncbi:prepilin peptidase [Candidatus Dependentiae bacterium]|nr:prepilin peptidase [Candidatus Dependentiae bacterium]